MKNFKLFYFWSITIFLSFITSGCTADSDEIEQYQDVNLQVKTSTQRNSSTECSTFNQPICLPRNYSPKLPGSCRYGFNYYYATLGAEQGVSDRELSIPCDNYQYLVSLRLSSPNECYRIGYELAYKYATTPRNCIYTRPSDDEDVPSGGGNR